MMNLQKKRNDIKFGALLLLVALLVGVVLAYRDWETHPSYETH